jgi:hypothetical protein
MVHDSIPSTARFPWGYLVAAVTPLGLIVAMFLANAIVGPTNSMALVMACFLLIGPVGAVAAGWGIYRLWRGEGRTYPALRWLVWLPGLMGIAGFVLG